MAWINVNLSLTLFGTTTAFETAYDDLQTRWSSIVTNNSTLFNVYMVNADKDDIAAIMTPSFTRLPPQSSSCLDGCLNVWEAEVYAAEEVWMDSCSIGVPVACWLGEIYYNAVLNAATYDFNDCANNC